MRGLSKASRGVLLMFVAGALTGITGCEDTSTEGGATTTLGALDAPCLADGTCDGDLVCVSELCAEGIIDQDVVTQPDVDLDTAQPDTAGGCLEGGCMGDPCDGPDDCYSGLCAPHLGTDVCTEACETECPAGWSCSLVALGGGDPAYICMSNHAHLCLPCLSADDCTNDGAEDTCVSYGEDGSFCGGSCEVDEDCPEGFLCQDTQTTRGGDSRQCRPADGLCACSEKAMNLGLVTDCSLTNDHGTCEGIRSCSPSGLGACDAKTPTPDDCNGLDDDCDGETDEVPCDDGDVCTVDVCGGENGCEYSVETGAPCDDENLETAGDECTDDGVCAGTPIDCPTGPCVVEAKPDGAICQVTWVDAGVTCVDEELTTKDDVCDGQGGCAGTPYECGATQCEASNIPDGAGCVVTYKAEAVGCDDEDQDTKVDICDGEGGCAGTPYECAPSQCEASSTPNGQGCDVTWEQADEPCDDEDPNTGADVCDGVGGCAGTPYGCAASQCEASSVPDGEGCQVAYMAEGYGCDDEDPDTKLDICDGEGGCAGTPYECVSSQCETSSTPDGQDCGVAWKQAGVPCDDENPTTELDVCDGEGECAGTPYGCAASQCEASSIPDGEGCKLAYMAEGYGCDDEDPDTKVDICDGEGGCAGTPYGCAPSQCETSSTPNGANCDVTWEQAGGPCDDENPTTESDVCDGEGGCAGTPYGCAPSQCEASSIPDGEDCNVAYMAEGYGCDDEDQDTKVDICDGEGACAGTPYECAPSQCQLTSTPDGQGCVTEPQPAGELCDDGDLGTKDDGCDGQGECAGTSYECEPSQCDASSTPDGDDCVTVPKADGVACDDQDPGTKLDICDGQAGCGGTPYECAPTPCQLTSTPDGVGCVTEPQPAGELCDDGALGTKDDGCDGQGECVGIPYECEPSQCVASSTPDGDGCVTEPKADGVACDDDDLTTMVDICDGQGGCAGTPYECAPTECQLTSTPDGVGCVTEAKLPGAGCNDGDPATVNDICDGAEFCAGSVPVCGDAIPEGFEACDDGNDDESDGCTSQCELKEPAPTIYDVVNTFTFTGADQHFTIPANVHWLRAACWGGGGTGSPTAGAGGFAEVTFDVTPGEELTIVVGDAGPKEDNAGAYGGGGLSDYRGGGGWAGLLSGDAGWTCSSESQTRGIVIAGGGGGSYDGADGGDGGGLEGFANEGDATAGGPGTQLEGGAASQGNSTAGTALCGGDGGENVKNRSGGGGGGFFGGGGGYHEYGQLAGPGGGGSSFIGNQSLTVGDLPWTGTSSFNSRYYLDARTVSSGGLGGGDGSGAVPESGHVDYGGDAGSPTISGSEKGDAGRCVLRYASVCGDQIIEGTETCDDGNLLDDDGCSATCQQECASVNVDGGSYVSVPDSDDWNFADGDFTIELWIYPTEATRQAIFAFEADHRLGIDFHYQGERNLNIWASSTGDSWNLLTADIGGGESGIGTHSITLDQWHHVAYVREGDTWRLYVDGLLDVSAQISGSVAEKDETMNVARWGDDKVAKFKGRVDDLRVWHVARTATELQATMNVALEGDEAGLVASWDFDEEEGTTATDVTPSAHEATLVGATWSADAPECADGATCGDGVIASWEGCDDGNLVGNDGCSAACAEEAFSSCKALLDAVPGSVDGVHSVDPDGAGGEAAFDVQCDMTTDGGGWTLVANISDAGSDVWSKFMPNQDTGLWDSTETLGDTITFTADYKSQAYLDVTSTSLLIKESNSNNVLRANGCWSTQSFQSFISGLQWDGDGSDTNWEDGSGAHLCDFEHFDHNDPVLRASGHSGSDRKLAFKWGERDGVQDGNKDRTMITTYHANGHSHHIDYPTGLGGFTSYSGNENYEDVNECQGDGPDQCANAAQNYQLYVR